MLATSSKIFKARESEESGEVSKTRRPEKKQRREDSLRGGARSLAMVPILGPLNTEYGEMVLMAEVV